MNIVNLFISIVRKYEEIYPPEVREFVYITDDTYTKRQVLRMEHLVLKVLSFFMSAPTANVFCERALETCKCDGKVKAMAMVRRTVRFVQLEGYWFYDSRH